MLNKITILSGTSCKKITNGMKQQGKQALYKCIKFLPTERYFENNSCNKDINVHIIIKWINTLVKLQHVHFMPWANVNVVFETAQQKLKYSWQTFKKDLCLPEKKMMELLLTRGSHIGDCLVNKKFSFSCACLNKW